MNLKKVLQNRPGSYWSKVKPNRKAWWNSSSLRNHINNRICGEYETGVIGALRFATGGQKLSRGISVGCGNGKKERALLHAKLVEEFDLFEVSVARANEAGQQAQEQGLESRINVKIADAFRAPVSDRYDLVYWDHSLHHMLDVEKALSWSIDVLKPGGVLLVNDYVGPTLCANISETSFPR